MRGLALAALCLLVTSFAHAGMSRCGDDVDGRAVPCDCGDVLVGSRTLGEDDPITARPCPGTGLMVDVPAGQTATLTLAGHVLAGSGRGAGIELVAGALTILGPGGVRGFDVGVFAPRGGLATVSDVTVAENRRDGLSLGGRGYTVLRCEAIRNGRDGFVLDGGAYRAGGNRALENGRYGFLAAGRDAGIAGNEASGNGRDGFRLRGRGHEVTAAVATANGGDGVTARIADGLVAETVTSANRGRGVRGVGSGLEVSGSTAHGNGRADVELRGAGARGDCEGGPCR